MRLVEINPRKDFIMKDQLVVVAGGGGFIGGNLVADLRRQGYKNYLVK